MVMGLLHLYTPPFTPLLLPTSSACAPQRTSFLSGQALRALDFIKCHHPIGKNSNSVDGCGASVAAIASRSRAKVIRAAGQDPQSKDGDVAYVAGATGKVGSRAVRELLKLGFRVRAGVRNKQKAGPLVKSVEQMESGSGTQYVEKLEIVECDLEKREGIVSAIGNASVVLCCIGASEKEIFDITGPYRIDYLASKNLIGAATTAKVDHFILLTSLGTNKIGFPAAILNLFWGVLLWKRKAEEALIASGLPYSIVRPGGMERPTDAFKLTHNLVLSTEDTLFGGLVSNLQVAELMAFMAKNRELSFCKVVEVVAETTAPLTPLEDLLLKIPSQRVDSSKPTTVALPKTEPPAAQTEVSQPQVAQKKPRPLSPYIVYEDLKPPTSPTPTPSTTPIKSKEIQDNATQPPPTIESKAKNPPPLSPYPAYEDRKPPSSPSSSPK